MRCSLSLTDDCSVGGSDVDWTSTHKRAVQVDFDKLEGQFETDNEE